MQLVVLDNIWQNFKSIAVEVKINFAVEPDPDHVASATDDKVSCSINTVLTKFNFAKMPAFGYY